MEAAVCSLLPLAVCRWPGVFFPYEKEIIAARKKLATARSSPKSALVILKGTGRPLDGWEHDFFRRSIAPAGVFWSLTAACFLGWR